jgi:alanine dehydrogenase
MVLILSNEEIQQVLSMDICMEAVEKAFMEMGNNNAFNIQRMHPYFPSSRAETFFRPKIMGGFVPFFGVLAIRICPEFVQFPVRDGLKRQIKIAAASGNRYNGLVHLYSSETGELLAILQDAYIQKMRVGATSAIGARVLAREDSHVLGLFGSGWQAGSHLAAFLKIRQLRSVKVFSPNLDRRVSFANEMSRSLEVEVVPVESPRAVVEGSDIVMTATSSSEPVFKGEWLEPGVHVGSIVNTDERNTRSELDRETFRRADLIVVNTKEFITQMNQRELLDPIEAGVVDWANIHELGKVLIGKAPRRTMASQITLFKNNVGLGIQFSAVGARILEEAKKNGIGKEIPSEWFLQSRKGTPTY